MVGTRIGTITHMKAGNCSNSPEDGASTTSDEVALSGFSNRQVGEGSDEGTVQQSLLSWTGFY